MTETMSFWRGRRTLITGASGFLGAQLAKLLIDAGAKLVGFDLRPSTWCLQVHGLDGAFPIVAESVMDLDAVRRALREERIEVVVHLAGQSKIEESGAKPFSTLDVNVRGTWTVLEACRDLPSLISVVCASSNHIYGPQQSREPFPEDAPLNQLDAYGVSKACADLIVRMYARQYGVPAVAVRNTNSFGPGDPHTSHVVTGTILSLLDGNAPVIRSDGSPVKAYLYAEDTMEAYMRVAEVASRDDVRGQAFNVTTDAPVSVLELVRTIVNVSDTPELQPIVQGKDLSQQGSYEHLSNARTKRVIGWSPRHTLEDGLRLTYAWYAKQGREWLRAQQPARTVAATTG